MGQNPITNPVSPAEGTKRIFNRTPQWLRIATVVLLFSLTILAVCVVFLMYLGKDREETYVNKDKVQAVFLTNGQVYFGKVKNISDKYIDMQDIYYLNSQQQPAASGQQQTSTSFALVKLGCELHGPTDQMVINREQVTFWENLKTDGKVADAIKKWRTQYPNGQDCNANNSTSSDTNTTDNTNTSNTNTGTTNTTNQNKSTTTTR